MENEQKPTPQMGPLGTQIPVQTPNTQPASPAFAQPNTNTPPQTPTTQVPPAARTMPVPSVQHKNRLPLYAIGAVAVLGFLGGAYWYTSIYSLIPVTITANESAFDLTINGERYNNITPPYQVKLKRGTYVFEASKNDFASSTKELTLERGSKNELNFVLSPQLPAAKVLEKSVLYPAYNKDNNSLLYFAQEGEDFYLYEYAFATGTDTKLTTKPIKNLKKATWSPTKQLVAVQTANTKNDALLLPGLGEYPEETLVNWVITLTRSDLVSVAVRPLNPGIKTLAFSPEGDRIVYLFDNGQDVLLATAQSDGSSFESIAKIESLTSPELTWSSDGLKVALYSGLDSASRASRADQNNVFVYSFATRSIMQLTDNGAGYGAQFSPNASKLLYESGNTLWTTIFANNTAEAVDTRINSSINRASWINDNDLAVIDTNGLWIAHADGSKDAVPVLSSSLPSSINEVIAANDQIIIIGSDAVFVAKR